MKMTRNANFSSRGLPDQFTKWIERYAVLEEFDHHVVRTCCIAGSSKGVFLVVVHLLSNQMSNPSDLPPSFVLLLVQSR